METFFLVLIPSLVVFLFLLGIYKIVFEQKVQAQENVRQALAPYKQQEVAQNRSERLLKIKTGYESAKQLNLELQLERANLLISPAEFIAISVVAFCVTCLVVLLLTGNLLNAILLSTVAYLAPTVFLHLRIWLRKKKAENDFPNILDAVVNCFKTGYGFSRSVQVVANNYDDPWGTEFGKMAVEMNLGHPLEEVMANLKRRMQMVDVELFASAVLTQKETGGNLGEILSTLAKTCRERMKLFRKVSALTAQGKLSAAAVSCVPLVIFGIMNTAFHPQVVAFLTNPIGILLMSVAVIWMLVGIGVLFKLVQLEV
jgi:tight adherence protein B